MKAVGQAGASDRHSQVTECCPGTFRFGWQVHTGEGAGLHRRERGRLLTGVVGGRRVMKRMVKGRMLMKESSGKLGGSSCRIVGDFC